MSLIGKTVFWAGVMTIAVAIGDIAAGLIGTAPLVFQPWPALAAIPGALAICIATVEAEG